MTQSVTAPGQLVDAGEITPQAPVSGQVQEVAALAAGGRAQVRVSSEAGKTRFELLIEFAAGAVRSVR